MSPGQFAPEICLRTQFSSFKSNADSESHLVVPPAFVKIQWKTYIVFGVFNLAMLVHVFFAFPETAGKTLEEVEDMFTDPLGPKYMGTLPWKTRIVTKRTLLLEKGEVDPEKVEQYGHQEDADRSGSEGKVA